MFKRIISWLLVFVMCFLVCANVFQVSHAALPLLPDGIHTAVTTLGDILFSDALTFSEYCRWLKDHKGFVDNCPNSPEGHFFKAKNPAISMMTGFFEVECFFCGLSASEYLDQLEEAKLNDLPPGLNSTNNGTTAAGVVGVGFADTDEELALSREFFASVDLYTKANAAPVGSNFLINRYRADYYDYYAILGKYENTKYNLSVLVSDVTFAKLPGSNTTASWPLGEFVGSGLSGTSKTDCSDSTKGFMIFLNYDDAAIAFSMGKTTRAIYYLREDSYIYTYRQESSGVKHFDIRNLGYINNAGIVGKGNYGFYAGAGHYANTNNLYPAFPSVVDVGESFDSSTRVSNVTNIFNEYNTTNNFTENNVVNYYIGTVDESNNVTNIYNTNIYNEDTLVFTEPVTGAQIQTTGWSYNYDTRSYDIKLTAGSFTMSDTDVTRIVATYGDESLTLTYYDSSNTALATDTYAYVLVAKDECTLYGHSYTYETVKEASCVSVGERMYTCTSCGDEYAEDVPMMEHAYTYSEIKAPTCNSEGRGTYTCGTCGNQFTEAVPKTDHIGEILERVETEYDEDGGVVSYGYTVYRCSLCGDQYTVSDAPEVEDEGWFAWIGKQFRKLADALINGLSEGLEYLTGTVIKALTDAGLGLIDWLFDLIDVDKLDIWYNWFEDGNPYFDAEFGTGTYTQDETGTEVDIWAH